MSDPVRTYTLKKPIQHGSETITELEFREPLGKDLDELPAGAGLRWGDMRKLSARLTGHPPTAFDTMSIPDVNAVLLITNELLGGDGPLTGET